LAGEVAERIAQDRHVILARFGKPHAAGVSFLEGDLASFRPGAAPRKPNQIARPVDAGKAGIAPSREFQQMSALAAADVQNAGLGRHARRLYDLVDLVRGIAVVLDDIAIGLEVERIENLAPPFGGEMRFKVGNWSQALARRAWTGTAGGWGFHDPPSRIWCRGRPCATRGSEIAPLAEQGCPRRGVSTG